jgi:hypothetical protein
MNKTINGLLIFVGGAAVGSLTAWQVTKNYYAQRAQEEIDSVKEVFSKKFAEDNEEHKEEKPRVIADKPSLEEYAKILNEKKYRPNEYYEEGDADETDEEEPEVITPDEFGELDYETVYLTYYADKVLATELDDVVEDIGGTIGHSSILRFGEYEEEILHVRNHQLRVDYEVTLDSRSFYEDIKGVSPADE